MLETPWVSTPLRSALTRPSAAASAWLSGRPADTSRPSAASLSSVWETMNMGAPLLSGRRRCDRGGVVPGAGVRRPDARQLPGGVTQPMFRVGELPGGGDIELQSKHRADTDR